MALKWAIKSDFVAISLHWGSVNVVLTHERSLCLIGVAKVKNEVVEIK